MNEPDHVIAVMVRALDLAETPRRVFQRSPSCRHATCSRRSTSPRCSVPSWTHTSLASFVDRSTGADWPVDHPLSALGYDGGGGIGSGCGMAVGAACALRDAGSDRLPLAVLGDGDFLMNASALWTGINKKVPLLVVVLNNRSFYNDEGQQETVAKHRSRPPENKHVRIVMNELDIDISARRTRVRRLQSWINSWCRRTATDAGRGARREVCWNSAVRL